MKRTIFLTIIFTSSTFFLFFLFLDEVYVEDLKLEQIYEGILLAIILSVVGITCSKYFSDLTTIHIQQELKRLESDFEQELKKLELKFEQLNKTKEF